MAHKIKLTYTKKETHNTCHKTDARGLQGAQCRADLRLRDDRWRRGVRRPKKSFLIACRNRTLACACARARTHTHAHTHVHCHTCTHTRAQTHAHIHMHTHTCVCMCMYTHKHNGRGSQQHSGTIRHSCNRCNIQHAARNTQHTHLPRISAKPEARANVSKRLSVTCALGGFM